MISWVFSEFIETEKIDYKTLDKCINASFHLLSIKKYSKNDHLTFNIDMENSQLQIIENSSGKDISLDFGRTAILAVRATVYSLIKLYKSQPMEFEILYSYAMNNEFQKYFEYLRIIFPELKSNPIALKKKQKNYDFDERYGDDESVRFCDACQQAPCMCSDPERTSTVWR